MDQITIALNGAGDLLAKVRSTVEGVFNGFHGKVGVTTIDNLKNKVYPSFRNIYEDVLCTFYLYTKARRNFKGIGL